jgi:hypothetical protein
LKNIEGTKVKHLERDKRRELERIAAERENLRLREEETMDEIVRLEEQKLVQDRELKEERGRKQEQVDNSEYYKGIMRKRDIEVAKQRGEQIAALQHKRNQLDNDRSRLLEDLDAANSDDPVRWQKNMASKWLANDVI